MWKTTMFPSHSLEINGGCPLLCRNKKSNGLVKKQSVMERYNRRRSGYEPSDTETEWHDSPPKRDTNGYDQSRRRQLALLKLQERQNTKSPYNNLDNNARSTSPYAKSERRRNVSPFVPAGERNGSNHDMSWGRERSRRTASAPRSRLKERSQQKHVPSVGDINEMVANAKISRMSNVHDNNNNFDSVDSVSPGDIFFSRDCTAVVAFNKNGNPDPVIPSLPKPPGYFVGKKTVNDSSKTNSSSVVSRQSSILSDSSGRTSASTTRFVTNRRKSQSDTWFFCIKKGSSCKKSNKSPGKERPFDEASFIEKAVVVESLRPFWADKHQPVSLNGFNCHKNEAQILQQFACSDIFPHILLKGPPGTGKKALTMCLLREMFGDPIWNISHDLRYFHILESKPIQVVVAISSSPHHLELNVSLESKAAYALTALVKHISSEYALTPEISVAPNNDYKVLVLYDVDKAAENIQHLIKWIMDCYSDSCKLILCCEDDVDIFESVKSRCKVVNVEAPPSHEVMEVLVQIAKKEGFELPTSFAAKIANKSKQNLRRAIMALEACKLHNYPFTEDQPIPLGWEEAVVDLAADILTDPFPKKLFVIRGKIQKLLGEFVHPKLILLKLVEQFLRGVDALLKREIYYWYAYYDKRLPSGTNALLKLEEFAAKFMSIYRKSSSNRKS